MKFSVVIVNYDSWPHTLRCIEALYGTGYEDFEVVVVDNDRRPAPELPAGGRLIRNQENLGFARACNQGIETSVGEFVTLINPDALVERGFFESVEAFLEDHPEVGVVGPKVLDGDGRVQLSARREISLVSGLLGRTSLLTRLFPESAAVKKFFPAAGELSGPTEVDWVSGACMVSRRETLDATGGFDERFFMYFEDADLCRRARETGRSVYYLPTVRVVHQTGASSGDRPGAIWRLHKSAFLYHRKHGPHGPLGLYDALVLIGLIARALVRLAAWRIRGR